MSTRTGIEKVAADFVADAKSLVDQARAGELRQMDLLDPVTPEEMVEAREILGEGAGNVTVLAEARRRRQGRPKGARNKRTDDFARYLLSFGQHPAITMMQIQATPPEILMEASSRSVTRISKNGSKVIVEESMSYGEAQALRARCAEGLLPYLESKKPVAVDLRVDGDFSLLIPGQNITEADARSAADGTFVPYTEYLDVDEDDHGKAAGNGG